MPRRIGPSYKEVYGMEMPTMPELKKIVVIECAIRKRASKYHPRMTESDIGAMAQAIFLALRDHEGGLDRPHGA
jgi:hypothetical protein